MGATEIILIGIKGVVGKNMATITEYPALLHDLQDAAGKNLIKVTWKNVESRLIDIDKLSRVLKEVKGKAYAVIASCPSTHFDKATELSRGNRNVQCCWGRVDDISGLERPMQNLTMAGKSASAAKEEQKSNSNIADRRSASHSSAARTVLTALYDYDATDSDELSFNKGDKIRLTAFGRDDGWLKGVVASSANPARVGAAGLFPANYTDFKSILTALYDYDATDSDELSIKLGDKIRLTAFGADDGWLKGVVASSANPARVGAAGLFPANYTDFKG